MSTMGQLLIRFKEALFPDHRLLWIIVVGFAIRFAVAPWTSWTYDTYPFYQGMVDQLAGIGPYGHMAFSYPPAFAFVEYPFGWFLSLFLDPSQWITFQPSLVAVGQTTGMVIPMVTNPWFNLTYKLPLMVADYLTAVLLYHFVVMVKDDQAARRVFILWFLNPLVLFVSSIYGNFDILAVFFSVLSLYCMYRRMYLAAGLAVGLGVAFKLFPMYLAFFYFAFLLGSSLTEWRSSTRLVPSLQSLGKFFAGSLLGASSILITIVVNPSMMVFLTGRMSNNDMGGVNIWGLVRTANALVARGSGQPADPASIITLVTNYLLILILFLVLISVFIMLRSSKDINERQLLFGSMFVFVILLLFEPVTHGHYLLWALPFLLLCSVYQERFEWKVGLLSIAGVLFWLGLQSYLAFFYPLSTYTGVVPTDHINQVVIAYYTGSNGISSEGARIVPTFLGVVALITALLPERIDPLYRLQTYLRRFGHEA